MRQGTGACRSPVGASHVHSSIGYSLIGAPFLSSCPEAFSGSTGVRRQGMSLRRALLMWACARDEQSD